MVSTLEIICLLQLRWRYVTCLTTMHKYLFLMKLDEPSSFSFPFAHYFTGSVSIPFLFYPYFVRYLEIAFSEKFICFRCFLSVLLNVMPKKKKKNPIGSKYYTSAAFGLETHSDAQASCKRKE